MSLARRVAAEGVGTALLLAAVVGSGIMAQRLAGGNVAVALLANTLATGGALLAIILAFGPISGAHLNPVVTLADAWRRGTIWRKSRGISPPSSPGPSWASRRRTSCSACRRSFASQHARSGVPLWLGEFVATFGLLAIIWGCVRAKPDATPFAVAAYIVGAYWFTSSTSFANPAVTIARSLSDTFAGIRPGDVAGFVAAQFAGAAAATAFFLWIDLA